MSPPRELVCQIQRVMTLWNHETEAFDLVNSADVADWRPYIPDEDMFSFYAIFIELGMSPAESFTAILTSPWT